MDSRARRWFEWSAASGAGPPLSLRFSASTLIGLFPSTTVCVLLDAGIFNQVVPPSPFTSPAQSVTGDKAEERLVAWAYLESAPDRLAIDRCTR